mgnify:CR=1 FL=1
MNREPRGRVFRALTGAGIILIASLGSVLAANIAIGNSNKATEFGQGVQRTVYCGSEAQTLKVIPVSAYKNKAGSSEPAGTLTP